MEKELQSKLVEILSAIQTATGKAADFTMAQLPDIAQQYVVYGRVTAALALASLLLVCAIATSFAVWAYRNPWYSTYSWHEPDTVRSDGNQATIFFSAFVAVMFFAFSVSSAITGSLVWFAPKVWLLKELAQLAK